MAVMKTSGSRIAGICTCVPALRFDNLTQTVGFSEEEIRKVVSLAGVAERRLAGESVCSSDLCTAAAQRLLDLLGWERKSVDVLVMVTQTPDYFLPSTACVIHQRLSFSTSCAAFDVGLGCSGYPYGLWLVAMALQNGGVRRALLLHGETPTRFSDKADRSVSLLFGDAGSATALEASDAHSDGDWHYALHSDGSGCNAMIINAGGFRERFSGDSRRHSVAMNGALVFNFTVKRVPALIDETLAAAGTAANDIDYFIFHQSNQFIIKHLCAKQSIPSEKVPNILNRFGNTGGVSIPLTLTEGGLMRPRDRALRLLLLGYGVGLSWGSALVKLHPEAILERIELDNR